MESQKKQPMKANTLELPKSTEEQKLEEGDPNKLGNPAKKKPQLRRSTAVNFEDDENALKTLQKSQFNDKDAEKSVSDENSDQEEETK